tara:strand:+ start:37013 stop:37828 length:816 start_codon:yes stop_codon:yes gene_type:complete
MEIKKIIHCADLHIRTFRMHEEYGTTFETFLEQIRVLVEPYEREEIRIVIAGDYVHQKITISNELLILGTWFLRELDKIAPVVIIPGNHDLLENNKDRVDSITPMVQLLPELNIQYYTETGCYVDNNIVWDVYSIVTGSDRPNIEEGRIDYGNDKTYIGLFHGPLIGSTTDIGYEIEHGHSLEIFEGNDIVMCGDIHKRQELRFKGIPIVMPSSLIQQNFGETVGKHGFLLWDVASKTYEEHDIETDYGFYQFKIDSINDIDEGKEVLTNK